ncbi:hypothetical protein WT24_19950 [Burkholderia sp. MSMB1078WGS]|nr:hypothetical protein WT24_19950 [Burkholderia sp. MSMB1078WGS]
MSISEMSNKGVANHHIETSAVRSILTRRAQLRSRWLGDWTVPFFGDEDAALSVYLKRIEIVQDATLDVDEKKRRIEALSSDLPPEQRRAEEEQKQQTQWLTSVDQLQKRNLSPEELRVAVTKIKGAEFAERFVAQQQADQAWDATYDRYASQRDQIRAQHLSPPDQERQLARLRAMFFSRQSDVLRAAGRDGSDTGKPW